MFVLDWVHPTNRTQRDLQFSRVRLSQSRADHNDLRDSLLQYKWRVLGLTQEQSLYG